MTFPAGKYSGTEAVTCFGCSTMVNLVRRIVDGVVVKTGKCPTCGLDVTREDL